MNELFVKAKEFGVRITAIPLSYLYESGNDIRNLSLKVDLNNYQKEIIEKKYVLNIPELSFQPKSLVIAIWQLKLAKTTFTQNNKTVSCIIDDSFTKTNMHENLRGIFIDSGFNLKYHIWMPLKRLSACSGLTEFGRNNITYASDWGSFIRIAAYFSDMPAGDHIWRKVKTMKMCSSCDLCISNCPTKAILPHRFLIDNEKCLSYINVENKTVFPEWIPSTAHHRLIECIKCQDICPANRKILKNITENIVFTESETSTLISGWKPEKFTPDLKYKLRYYINGKESICIPRNLKAMFNNPLLIKYN